MAKRKKKKRKEITVEKSTNPIWQNIPSIQKKILAILFLAIVLVIFFAPMVFDGLSPIGTDVVGHLGNTHQISVSKEKTGELSLWNPAVFSGMPIYHRPTLQKQWWTIDGFISNLYDYTHSGFGAFIYYLIGAMGMFFLTQYLGIPIWGSILSSLAFVFMPHYEVLVQAGHFQKFRPIMIMPWVILSFEYLIRKGNWSSLLFFIIALSVQLRTKHYQIVFYTILIMGFIGIGYLIVKIRGKEYIAILKRFGFLIIALFFATLMSLQVIIPVLEYAPYSIRGGTGEEGSTGLDYDYATGWSFSPREFPKLLIPNFYGGSSSILYNRNDVPQLKGHQIPGYWGDFPFTEGGDYIGILTFIFALLGIIGGFQKKNRVIIAMSFFICFAFIISFGRHFPFLHRLFFYTIPFFNKFRIPSMILTAIYFGFALLAGFGIRFLFEEAFENQKKVKKYIIIILVFLFILSVIPYIFKGLFSFEKPGESLRYSPQILDLIKSARYDLMKGDALRLLWFTIVTGFLLLLYLRKRFRNSVLAILLVGYFLTDLLPINKRFLDNLGSIKKFEKSYFTKSSTDQFLLNDSSYYRIYVPYDNPFNNNNWSYYHQSIGGYRAAKLRIYQDIIESSLIGGPQNMLPKNWNVLNMLNTKYIVVPNNPNVKIDSTKAKLIHVNDEHKIFQNRDVFSRAFFIGYYEVISQKATRLNRLNQSAFDPSAVAILENNPGLIIGQPDSSMIKFTVFEHNRIEMNCFTNKSSLLVLSEIYYPPGWQATIDGVETEIFKTNHILRSIFVPEGNHVIKFEFYPKSFFITGWISGLFGLIITLALIGLGVFKVLKKRKKNP